MLVERYEDKRAGCVALTPDIERYPLSDNEAPAVERVAEIWGKGNSWQPPPIERKSTIPPETLRNPQQLRPRFHAAMRDWLLKVSKRRSLIIAVDDIHRIDGPSAAFVALLANEVAKNKAIVVVTIQTNATSVSSTAIKLLKDSGHTLEIKPLGIDDIERLLQSVFGETPNIRLLANRFEAISHGYPRGVMQLTRHLIDRGVIRYRAAAWSVPSTINTSDIPSQLSDAMRAVVDNLSPTARTLAQLGALSEERSFSYTDCFSLDQDLDAARLIKALDELVVAEILATDGQYYSLSHPGWSPVLVGTLDKERKRAFHLKVASMFERRGNKALHAAKHLISADQEQRALDMFIGELEKTNQNPSQNRMLALDSILDDLLSFPPDWVTTLESLLDLCKKYQRPPKHQYYLHIALITYNVITALADRSHYLKVIEQLRQDSGLDDYHQLGDSLAPGDRLWRALEIAQKRFNESPPSERVLAPDEAINMLAQTSIAVISYTGISFDYPLIQSLPSLQPFTPLAAALDI